ncbi:MAG: hypothetical protein V1775_11210 [Bacteroidota bacterium]
MTYHFNGNWELNHQFMVLTFADTAAQPLYTARVFIGYYCVIERYVCHWLDNSGGRFSETPGYGTLTETPLNSALNTPTVPLSTGSHMKINVIPGKCTPPQKTLKGHWLLSVIYS